MKKKLLFVINDLECGGAQKALISLLETLDYSRFDVDLYLFNHKGLFLNKIPKKVNLLPEPENYKYFDMPIRKSLEESVKKGSIYNGINRCVLGFLAKTENNGAVVEQKFWAFLKRSLKKIPKEYDAAVGFQEKNPIYFICDMVKAKKKIGWIHTDYNKLGVDTEKENFYFNYLDHIVTVSSELVSLLKGYFPKNKEKVECIHNIISSQIVKNLSIDPIKFEKKAFSIVSVGRLAKEKGLDLTLEAFKMLIDKDYDLIWYLIGEGNMRSILEKRIKEYNLTNRVIFLGQQSNPYPYIAQADIFLQTSWFEGKSISIEEAKILGKPILITNFNTANDHIKNGVNGMIAEMNAESVFKCLEELINNKKLRLQFSKNLINDDFGTQYEINKIYNLIS